MSIALRLAGVDKALSSYHNREDLIRFLIARARGMAALPEAYRRDEFLVPACVTRIWLHAKCSEGRLFFMVDSDSAIAKGMASLVVEVYSGATPVEVQTTAGGLAGARAFFVAKLARSRRLGVAHLVERVFELAGA